MILTKENKTKLRSKIFRHLDGIGIASPVFHMFQRGVLDVFKSERKQSLNQLVETFKANDGYLNASLRLMASQGWMSVVDIHEKDVIYELTDHGRIALDYIPLYQKAIEFLPYAIEIDRHINEGFDGHAFAKLNELFIGQQSSWGIEASADQDIARVQEQVLTHIEGLIAGPIIVALGINGMFHKYFSIAPFKTEEFSQHHDQLQAIIEFFEYLGWFSCKDNIYNFTPTGLFFARRAAAYGVTVSYLPMFSRMNELLFGNPNVLWHRPPGSPEIHVNRTMNVWGSGGAHSVYFKKIDEIVIDIFNKPIHEQPKGFADMGSGNGAFLEHIFEVIWSKTLRGKMLDEYPLFIVGSDFNEAALVETRKTLNQADIWAKVVWGDIGKPDLLAKELKEKYDINLGDLLNVRSFLDHNRIFEVPKEPDPERQSNSTGAFSYRGKRLSNEEVEQNLVDHLKKWSPYVRRFGLLVLELHTIAPETAAGHVGKTAVTAYDATHAFSDQYIVEHEVFLKAAAEAGLYPTDNLHFTFPSKEQTTVSIQLLKSN